MYGTVMRYRMKPGTEDAVRALTDEFGGNAPAGFVGSYTYRLDSGGDEYITAVMFDSREAYQTSSASPQQDAWYRRMSELMASEPHWMDGEIVDTLPRR